MQLDVRVLDSKSVTLGLGLDGALGGRGGPRRRSAPTRSPPRSRTRSGVNGIWATLDTLDNLKKGGRIGGAKALVASLLSIKPAISLHDGVVAEAGKPRTRGKALRWLADRVLEEAAVEKLCVVHGQAPDVEEFLELLAPKYSAVRAHRGRHRPDHRRPRRSPRDRRHLPTGEVRRIRRGRPNPRRPTALRAHGRRAR